VTLKKEQREYNDSSLLGFKEKQEIQGIRIRLGFFSESIQKHIQITILLMKRLFL